MLERLFKFLTRQSRLTLAAVGFALVGLIGIIDYLTGHELSFSIFYLIPISLVAWYVSRQTGLLLSVVSAAVWLTSDLLAGNLYLSPMIPYWNAGVRLGFFLIVTYTLVELQASHQRKEELIKELEATLTTVKLLEGILPMCSFCKKIRDKDDQWNTIESYITDHSEARFSHTLCPDCAKEHYPEYFKKDRSVR